MASCCKKNGFTLVETMIVAALFGVLALVLFSSFAMGMRVWKRSALYNLAERKAVLSLERMGVELRQTLNVPSIGFWGEKGRIEFANIFQDKMTNISYEYFPQEKSVKRSTMDQRQMSGEDPVIPSRRVIAGVQDFSMSFYGPEPQTGNFSFFENWNYSASGIPKAVKIAITLENGKYFEKITPIPIAQ